MGTRWHGGRQQITFGPQAAAPGVLWRFIAVVALAVIVAEVLGAALAAFAQMNDSTYKLLDPTVFHANPPPPGR